MEFLLDPHIWAGLATLIVLEVVLGIDNLVFIAILADKLPPDKRDRARIIGLLLALLMRIALLFSITWVITLTRPLFSIGDFSFSGRDVILILGGLFLLAKGTMELHERLEGSHSPKEGKVVHAVFWQVIVQIVVLDAVFSLDSVITAVAIVDELWVMIAAVAFAICIMILASKPLMAFVSKHPTVVILCLGFLLMIGFSLVVEGFGFYVPKGYLYAAIGFSILIEAANQFARYNREKVVTTMDLRQSTSDAILRLLGGRSGDGALSETVDVIAEQTASEHIFRPEEKGMIRGVLDLASRPVSSIMTPRNELEWLDLDSSDEELRRKIAGLTHSRIVLARGQIDEFVGIALTKDILLAMVHRGALDWPSLTRQPAIVHERTDVLTVMEQLRTAVQMAMVIDEYGSLEGIVTPTDVLEAIAGEFPDIDEEPALAQRQDDGSWIVDGFMDIRQLESIVEQPLLDGTGRYSTLGGFVLTFLERMPEAGDELVQGDYRFTILSMNKLSVGKVKIEKISEDEGQGRA